MPTEMSRVAFPASIRGRRRQRWKASRFARIVVSDPAPPAMYPNAPGSSLSSAARSQSAAATGHSGGCCAM